MALALELRRHDLVDVQEPVLLQPDLDERRLHPGQHVVDGAQVDVARDRAALRPLEVDLGDAVVLEHGDALLTDVDGDEELALRLGERRAARGLAAAALLRAFALAALRSPLWPCLLGSRLLFGLLRLGLGGLAGAPAPPATAATAPGLRGGRLSRLCDGGLRCGYGLGCFCGSGSLDRRLLLGRLSASKPAQAKSPSCARAAATPPGEAARSVRGK